MADWAAEGLMIGTLFTDCLALHLRHQALRRSGWPIVRVDRTGFVVAAAWGPVPFDKGPEETAPEAEEYCMFMMAQLSMPPFVGDGDCK